MCSVFRNNQLLHMGLEVTQSRVTASSWNGTDRQRPSCLGGCASDGALAFAALQNILDRLVPVHVVADGFPV